MKLSILYRGPLSSCNYDCGYCPFAKRKESRAELRVDKKALLRFSAWIERRTRDELGVLFTPWGEALIRPWYRHTMARLSQLPQVRRVAIQTNLSCALDWVEACDKESLALWTTYHPREVRRDRFLEKCDELLWRGVRFSVGVVGLKEHREEIKALRAALPPSVYLWINALKDQPNYYNEEDLRAFAAIDPLFSWNTRAHPSAGASCRAGAQVISVDGEGTIRRCHFIKEPIGNLYGEGLEAALGERACTNLCCGCHIGYVHLDRLGLDKIFGAGILERIPEGWPEMSPSLV